MSWIKSRIVLILSGITAIAVLAARYFYAQANTARVKVAQGEAKAVAEIEKAKLEALSKEIKSVEEHRKALVDQWRRYDADHGERG